MIYQMKLSIANILYMCITVYLSKHTPLLEVVGIYSIQ